MSAPLGGKFIAGKLKVSPQLYHKWMLPTGVAHDGRVNPPERVKQITQVTGDPQLVQWLCEQAGGYFVANAAPASLPAGLLPAENQTVREFGDLIAVVSVSAGDNCITAAEAADIRARWEQLKSVTEGFVRDCERGHFLNRQSPVAGAPAKSISVKVSPAAPRPSARL